MAKVAATKLKSIVLLDLQKLFKPVEIEVFINEKQIAFCT